MTKFVDPKFAVAVGSDQYRDNWDTTFGNTSTVKLFCYCGESTGTQVGAEYVCNKCGAKYDVPNHLLDTLRHDCNQATQEYAMDPAEERQLEIRTKLARHDQAVAECTAMKEAAARVAEEVEEMLPMATTIPDRIRALEAGPVAREFLERLADVANARDKWKTALDTSIAENADLKQQLERAEGNERVREELGLSGEFELLHAKLADAQKQQQAAENRAEAAERRLAGLDSQFTAYVSAVTAAEAYEVDELRNKLAAAEKRVEVMARCEEVDLKRIEDLSAKLKAAEERANASEQRAERAEAELGIQRACANSAYEASADRYSQVEALEAKLAAAEKQRDELRLELMGDPDEPELGGGLRALCEANRAAWQIAEQKAGDMFEEATRRMLENNELRAQLQAAEERANASEQRATRAEARAEFYSDGVVPAAKLAAAEKECDEALSNLKWTSKHRDAAVTAAHAAQARAEVLREALELAVDWASSGMGAEPARKYQAWVAKARAALADTDPTPREPVCKP